MAIYTASEPQWKPSGGTLGPRTSQVYPAQTAAWRAGDILTLITTGTIVTPTGGAGTMVGVPGPSFGLAPVPFNIGTNGQSVTQGVVTVSGVTAASYPAQTLFGVLTYTTGSATNETLISVPFLINTAAGIQPRITVAATGAPATTTSFRAYAGFQPNSWYLQGTDTAFAANYSFVYPLTNSVGVNRAAAGISTNIVGLADCDSDAYYAGPLGATAGGSQATGKRSLFGATQSYAPGWTNDPFALPVTKLQSGQVEMCLTQPYSNALLYAAVGFNIDPLTNTGYFVADTSQTAAGTIQAFVQPIGYGGDVGDQNARVIVQVNGSAVI